MEFGFMSDVFHKIRATHGDSTADALQQMYESSGGGADLGPVLKEIVQLKSELQSLKAEFKSITEMFEAATAPAESEPSDSPKASRSRK